MTHAVPGRVRLRPATLADVPELDRWRANPVYEGEFNDFGRREHSSYRSAVESGTLVDGSGGLLVVEVTEKPREPRAVGTVTWRSVAYGPNPESRCWNIGVSFVPAERGKGYGWRVQRLLVEHLFATTGANRVEASTDVTNVASQRSLEKAGFIQEGVLRGAQFRAGGWHDLVSYSVLRADR